MQTGTIYWLKADRGYGFLKPNDNSQDIFLHLKELEKIGLNNIDKGQKLSF